MPAIDYAAVRRQIPMSHVLQLLRYEPAIRRGAQLRGPCPLLSTCGARSFSVHLKRDLFHCFSCHAGGNQLDLWADVHNLSLHQAAQHLCRLAGIAVPRLDHCGATHNQ